MRRLILLLLASLVLVGGCARANPASYEDAAYADAVCVDPGGQRVPDSYCPIGDDAPPPGYQYSWRYRPYQANGPAVIIPYTGYHIDAHDGWTDRRPVNITTININRGSFPENPPAGSTASSFKADPKDTIYDPKVGNNVNTSPANSVTRGGLGSTTGSKFQPVPGSSNAKRGQIAPPPAGARPMGKARAASRPASKPR